MPKAGDVFDHFCDDYYEPLLRRRKIDATGFRDHDSRLELSPHFFEAGSDAPYALVYALIDAERQLQPWSFQSTDAVGSDARYNLYFTTSEDAVLARLLVDG